MGICQSIINNCFHKNNQFEIPFDYQSKIKKIIDNELVIIEIDEDEEEECIICMDIINKKECRPTRCIINECKLPCHFICLQRWFDRYNKCPICNANWDEIPIGYTIQKIKDKVTYKIE